MNKNIRYKGTFGIKKGLKGAINEELLLEGETSLSTKDILRFCKKKFKDYHFFRVVIINGEKPNFINCLNWGRK